MGRIPRWPRLAVARGMNKGNCSFFARSARFSSGRGRISIYFETSSNSLRSPITFRPPRSIPFSSTKPANFTIKSTNFNPSTPGFYRQLAKVFHHLNTITITPTPLPSPQHHCNHPNTITITSTPLPSPQHH